MTDAADTLDRPQDAPSMQACGDELPSLLLRLLDAIEELTARVAPKDFMTDAQIIRRIGVPEKIAYDAIRELDRNRASGFPRKQKFWGDRRYWPAVKAYLDATNGLKIAAQIDAARLIPERRPPQPAAASNLPLRRTSRRGHDQSNTAEDFRRTGPRDETAS